MGHDHDHTAGVDRRRLGIALAITATVFVAEVVGAIVTGSLALLVDAAHMLTDVAGLVMALTAANLATRPPSDRFTWGFRRAEVLAALAQAAVLLAVGIYTLVEGVSRLVSPPEIAPAGLLVFGVIGLAGNIASLAVLAGSRRANLNLRAAFLEVSADALGSVAVIVSAIVIALTGWERADAVAAILIALLIIPRTLLLLRDSSAILLESTPKGLDLAQVREHLRGVPHVIEVHDVHASLIATGVPVLTAHVVVEAGCFSDGHAGRILKDLQTCVAEHFPVNVEHSTFQIEPLGHTEPHAH